MNTERKYSVVYRGEFQSDNYTELIDKIDEVLEDMGADFRGTIKVFEFNKFDGENACKESQNSNI